MKEKEQRLKMWMMNLWKKLQRLWLLSFWIIWLERNNQNFNVKHVSNAGLWENICNQSVLPAPWALRRLAQGELLAKNPCWEQSLSAFIFSLPQLGQSDLYIPTGWSDDSRISLRSQKLKTSVTLAMMRISKFKSRESIED